MHSKSNTTTLQPVFHVMHVAPAKVKRDRQMDGQTDNA